MAMPIVGDTRWSSVRTSSSTCVHVLNVNDDEAQRYVITRALVSAGFEVVEAGSALDAMTVLASADLDIVVLDVKLPDDDGRAVCRRIKAASATPLPVVLLSALCVTDADRVAGFESGADMYLTAPVPADVLVAAIDALVRARRAHVELLDRERAARAEAEEGRRVLDALMRHIPEGITIADAPDVRIRMVSRFGQQLVGRPADELVDIPSEAHQRAWGVYHSDGVTPAVADELPLTRAVKKGETVIDEEWVLRRDGAPSCTVLCNAGPILDDRGTTVGGIVAWRDITARKELEAENDGLLLSEQAARERAEAANRAKDGLLAVIAHELRNPLSAALGAFALLERLGGRPAEVEKARGILGRQLRQMGKLIEDLLVLCGETSGKLRLDRRPLDLAQAASECVDTLAATGKLGGRDVQLSATPAWVNADPSRLDQIVSNLIGNAVKFTLPDGTIRVTVERLASFAVLRIVDDGRGIPGDVLPHVFEPFFSAGGPEGRSAGFGIGLAIVRQLVEAHGGAIEAASAGPGQGATFTVRLPLLRPA